MSPRTFSWHRASSTADESSPTYLLSIERDDDGSWIVSDGTSLTYGHGQSLLHALCDYHAALVSTFGMLENEPVSARVARQLTAVRWLLGRESES